MSDYDAFGRKKKDDGGLGDLGWGTSDDPSATKQPPVTATPTAAAPQPSPQPTFQTPPSSAPNRTGLEVKRRRNPVVLVVQFLVLGGVAAAIYFAVAAGNNAAHTAIDTFKTFTTPQGTTHGHKGNGTDEGNAVPKQIKPRNFFRPADFASALKVLNRETPGQVTNFSMRKEYMSVQIYRRGKAKNIYFSADAEVPDVQSTTSGASLSPGSFLYREIDPKAPNRLMKAADARLNQSPNRVDYFVVSKAFGAMQWYIYYKGGPYAQGDGHGRYTRKLG
jgi:hypothetical protein